jgi:hypothetical protein
MAVLNATVMLRGHLRPRKGRWRLVAYCLLIVTLATYSVRTVQYFGYEKTQGVILDLAGRAKDGRSALLLKTPIIEYSVEGRRYLHSDLNQLHVFKPQIGKEVQILYKADNPRKSKIQGLNFWLPLQYFILISFLSMVLYSFLRTLQDGRKEMRSIRRSRKLLRG